MSMLHYAISCGRSRYQYASSIALRSLSTTKTTTTTYASQKKAAKELRRKRYFERLERAERVKTRRKGVGQIKKAAFKDWFDTMMLNNHYHDRKARREGLGWKIKVATVLERLPTKLAPVPKWESDYLELREYLDSFDFEYPPELNNHDDFLDGVIVYEEDEAKKKEKNDGITEEEEEDKKEEVVVEDVIDDSDITNFDRKLDTKLFFAMKDNEKSIWEFPSTELREGETIRQGAERLSSEVLGDDFSIITISNCPAAVRMDYNGKKKDDKKKKEFYGTKTFFFKIQYEEGNPTFTSSSSNNPQSWGWLDRSELSEDAKTKNDTDTANFYHYLL